MAGVGGLDEIGLKAVIEGVGAYLSNLDKIEKAEKDAAKAATEVENKSKAMGSMLTKMSLVGTTAFAGLGVLAVKFAMDFENQMDQVGAVLQANDADMMKLKDTAKQLGADTAFSAGEAAKAMEELAAGGRSVAQIIGGEAQAAVSLAAAGNYDLANSAKTIATTMDIWKDSQIETNDVVNRLAGAANSSRFGVEDMSQAIASGGGVAAQAGVSFQDFSTVIAATASSFNSGSDAGTSFKTFITSLSGNSEKAKDMIKELGLEFYTTAGTLKPMSEIVNELSQAMMGLTQEQQTVALKTIFGNDAFRTAAGLMKMTGDEFTAMSNKMRDTDAATVAEQRMSNLSGTLEELTGSLQTMAIQTGEMVLPMLNELAKVATHAVNAFAAMPQSSQALVMGIGAVVVALPAMISLTEKAAKVVLNLDQAWKSGNVRAGLFAAGIGAIIVATDIMLQKFTGAGLTDRIFGDVSKMEGNAAAMREWNAAVLAGGPNVDKLALSQRQLAEMTERSASGMGVATTSTGEYWNQLLTGQPSLAMFGDTLLGNDRRLFGFNVGLSDGQDKMKQYNEQTKVLAQQMMSAGAGVEALWTQYTKLPPELQKTFDAETNVVAAHEEAARTASMGADVIERMVRDGLTPAQQAMAKFKAETPPAMNALELFNATLEEGEDRAKAFEKVLDTLAGRFESLNPEVIAARGELAAVDEELADLERSGGEWSETLGMTKTQLEEAKARLEDFTKAGGENETAIKGMRDEMKLYIGDGLLNLESAVRDSNLSLEEQIDAEIRVGKALRDLATGDIPKFIAGLDEMDNKVPGTAQIIYDALGPDLKAKLAAFAPQMAEAGVLIGDALTQGLGNAVARGMANVNVESKRQMAELEAAMRIAAGITSPSKMTYQIGMYIAKGLELGIAENMPAVNTTAVTLMRDMFVDAREVVEAEIPLMGVVARDWSLAVARNMMEALDEGRELTDEALSNLIESAYDLIDRAPLPAAAQRAAQDVITSWVIGIGNGQGLANQAVADFFTDISAQIDVSGAKTAAEQQKWLDILTNGIGGDTEIPWAMRPGGENPGNTSIAAGPSSAEPEVGQWGQFSGQMAQWNGKQWIVGGMNNLSVGPTVEQEMRKFGTGDWRTVWKATGQEVSPLADRAYNGTSQPVSNVSNSAAINIDFSGASFSGNQGETEESVKQAFRVVLAEVAGRDAFLSGVR